MAESAEIRGENVHSVESQEIRNELKQSIERSRTLIAETNGLMQALLALWRRVRG